MSGEAGAVVPSRQHRKVVRSRNGCLTCKRRKVKCDETRPHCRRCDEESRHCAGYAQQVRQRVFGLNEPLSSTSSSRRGTPIPSPIHNHHHQQQQQQQQRIHAQPLSPSLLGPPHTPAPVISGGGRNNHADVTASDFEHLFASVMRSYDSDNSAFAQQHVGSLSDWMNGDQSFVQIQGEAEDTSSAAALLSLGGQQQPLQQQQQQSTPYATTEAITPSRSTNAETNTDATLQARLHRICTSPLQLEAVSRFFNFVLQTFHLVPAEANIWRSVFGQLCLVSPLTLDFVTAVGLISLSLVGPVNRRALAHAHLSRCLKQWFALVEQNENTSPRTEKQTLEIIAGAILVGHVEQFDNGLGRQTGECMERAMDVALAVVSTTFSTSSSIVGTVDTGPGSPFRFLARVLLWWDVLSRTLAPLPRPSRARPLLDTVRAWEADTNPAESVLQSIQCVCGWPIDLLDAVMRILNLSDRLQGQLATATRRECDANDSSSSSNTNTRRGGGADLINFTSSDSVVTEARNIEIQIRTCRPQLVRQDTFEAAAMRYTVFEVLQSGVLIYFSNVLLADSSRVMGEIHRVVAFLNRRQRVCADDVFSHASPALSTSSMSTSMSTSMMSTSFSNTISTPTQTVGNESGNDTTDGQGGGNSSSSSSNSSTNQASWLDRAPDGALIWSYLQAATNLTDAHEQALCRATLIDWSRQADCGATDICIELVDDVWRRQSISGIRTSTWREVLKERKWSQLLLF